MNKIVEAGVEAAMFSDPETLKKISPASQQNAESPEVKTSVPLEAMSFVVLVQYAKGTRWTVSDETLRRGLEGRAECFFTICSDGMLPIVTVTKGAAS